MLKKKILDEDTYLNEMGQIIEKDFFPDLKQLRAQNAYLDAESDNDITRMQQIRRAYTGRLRVESPATFETPLVSQPSEDFAAVGQDDDVKSIVDNMRPQMNEMNLNQFVANVESEDNADFMQLIKAAQEKEREKHPWRFKNEKAIQDQRDKQLALPSIEQQAIGAEKPLALDSWTYTNENSVMFYPKGQELTPIEKAEAERNMMEIIHENTRLRENPFDEQQSKSRIQALAESQARGQEGRIGVDGKIVTFGTPNTRGFSYVATPSPAPGVSDSPAMIWGEIDNTPYGLKGNETPCLVSGPSFRMPQVPKRERLALELADRAQESNRDRKRKAAAAAQRPPSSPHRSALLGSMSPAAKKLASSSLKFSFSDTSLRTSYSPSSSPSATTSRTSDGTPRWNRKAPLVQPRTPLLTPKSSKDVTQANNSSSSERVT